MSRLLTAALALALSLSAAEPIRLHPRNPHCFEFRGKPVVLVTSGEHYGSVLNPAFDYRKYLDTLAADGLNYTRIFGGSYVEVPGRSFGIRRNTLAPEPGRFLAPWVRAADSGYEGGGNKFDLDRWSPEYFERYRAFLTEAGKRGIVVEITFFSSTYQEAHWKLSPFHPSNNVNNTGLTEWKKLNTLENGAILAHQERYVRKLVHEAAAFDNVIFEIQNEPWSDRGSLAGVINPYLRAPARDQYPNSIDLADSASASWQARVAEWIASEESGLPAKHLVAQCYANFGAPVRALAPGVGMVNFHYAYPVAAETNYGLNKAIGYDETGFLGSEDDPYLRQAWNFLLSGGSLFDSLDYSFSVGHEDGADTEPNGPGGGSPTLRRRLGILSRFLHSMSLPDLVRDPRVVAHASGVSARALSTPAGDYAIYLDGDGPSDLTLRLSEGQYTGEWLDIRTGAATKLPPFAAGEPLRTPEFRGGLALHLTRQ
jgi:hypothetical protein